jgi:parallel beta-helix repeat protein
LLQPLEGRIAPATYTVSNTNDAGSGSLRQAILDANANPGADTIVFDSSFTGTQRTISLTSGQLSVTDALTISGTGAGLLTVRRDPAAVANFRIFEVTGATPLSTTLSGLTISGGKTSGTTAVAAGGGVRVGSGQSVTIQDAVISGNSAGTAGGGIQCSGGTLTVRSSTISGNTSATDIANFYSSGGGICVSAGGTLLVQNCTISGNTTAAAGGGVMLYGVSGGTVRNSTISSNTSTFSGGGLGADSGTLTVQNCTVTDNKVTGGAVVYTGGGIANVFGGAQVSIESTVVANNTNAAMNSPDESGAVAAKFSLIRNQTGTTITDGGNNLPAGADPLFAAGLANNGGPTQTIALQASSPLIDKGSNPANLTTDQRGSGFPRVVGATADIGAFEVQTSQTPAQVSSAVVNAGQQNLVQRSMVTSFTVTFNRVVTFTGAVSAAFQLARTGPGTPNGNVTLAVDLLGSTTNQTVAKLTFSGSLAEGPAAAPSLIDGNYMFTVLSGQVQGGVQGGDNVTSLFRLFGDVNGDRAVDGLDLTAFRNAFGSVQGNASYVPFLDFNGDGAIDGADLTQFRNRFGVILP